VSLFCIFTVPWQHHTTRLCLFTTLFALMHSDISSENFYVVDHHMLLLSDINVCSSPRYWSTLARDVPFAGLMVRIGGNQSNLYIVMRFNSLIHTCLTAL